MPRGEITTAGRLGSGEPQGPLQEGRPLLGSTPLSIQRIPVNSLARRRQTMQTTMDRGINEVRDQCAPHVFARYPPIACVKRAAVRDGRTGEQQHRVVEACDELLLHIRTSILALVEAGQQRE